MTSAASDKVRTSGFAYFIVLILLWERFEKCEGGAPAHSTDAPPWLLLVRFVRTYGGVWKRRVSSRFIAFRAALNGRNGVRQTLDLRFCVFHLIPPFFQDSLHS
jgi:hypothetical protein